VSQLYQVGQLGCAIGAVQYTSNPDVHLLQITPLSRRIRIKAPVPGAGRENDATLLAVEIEELIVRPPPSAACALSRTIITRDLRVFHTHTHTHHITPHTRRRESTTERIR
jgi:hypothetical protein